MRLSEKDVQIALYACRLFDLLQGEQSSLILGSIKTYKTSIGLQASSLPE